MKKPSSATVKPKAVPLATPTSEIRKHYYLDRYVIIAPKRNLRPDSFAHAAEPHKAPNPTCPFCGHHEATILGLPSVRNWQVKVVENAFPALTPDNPKAFGHQEVVVDTPNHDEEFSELSTTHIELIFNVYKRRLAALKAVPGIRYVLIFKNDGPVAGASIAHAHAQIIALPLVPPKVEYERDALNHYHDEHNTCAVCDVITWEESQKVRLIAEDKHMVAVAPYAATDAFEVWLIPRRHEGMFGGLTAGELHSLASMLKKITAKLDSVSYSFNYFLQESVVGEDHHFILKIHPRVIKYAGAELGTGIVINPVSPEYATLWYQGKL